MVVTTAVSTANALPCDIDIHSELMIDPADAAVAELDVSIQRSVAANAREVVNSNKGGEYSLITQMTRH